MSNVKGQPVTQKHANTPKSITTLWQQLMRAANLDTRKHVELWGKRRINNLSAAVMVISNIGVSVGL